MHYFHTFVFVSIRSALWRQQCIAVFMCVSSYHFSDCYNGLSPSLFFALWRHSINVLQGHLLEMFAQLTFLLLIYEMFPELVKHFWFCRHLETQVIVCNIYPSTHQQQLAAVYNQPINCLCPFFFRRRLLL